MPQFPSYELGMAASIQVLVSMKSVTILQLLVMAVPITAALSPYPSVPHQLLLGTIGSPRSGGEWEPGVKLLATRPPLCYSHSPHIWFSMPHLLNLLVLV
jgi:hypothetical protein